MASFQQYPPIPPFSQLESPYLEEDTVAFFGFLIPDIDSFYRRYDPEWIGGQDVDRSNIGLKVRALLRRETGLKRLDIQIVVVNLKDEDPLAIMLSVGSTLHLFHITPEEARSIAKTAGISAHVQPVWKAGAWTKEGLVGMGVGEI